MSTEKAFSSSLGIFQSQNNIDLTRHVKIWFSKNRDIPLGEKNEERLREHITQYPHHKISVIVDKMLLSENGRQQLDSFCASHPEIILLDLEDLKEELTELELKLLENARQELTHEYGTVAAASDIVRWFKPVIRRGVYTDFDVKFKLKNYLVSCLNTDVDSVISRVIAHSSEYPSHAISLLYHPKLSSEKLQELTNAFPQIKLISCEDSSLLKTIDLEDLNSVEVFVEKNLERLTEENPDFFGMFVKAGADFPIISEQIEDKEFLLSLICLDDEDDEGKPCISVVCDAHFLAFANTNHPLIQAKQDQLFTAYNAEEIFYTRYRFENLEKKVFSNVFELREAYAKEYPRETYLMRFQRDIIFRSGDIFTPFNQFCDAQHYSIAERVARYDLAQALPSGAVISSFDKSWLELEKCKYEERAATGSEVLPAAYS